MVKLQKRKERFLFVSVRRCSDGTGQATDSTEDEVLMDESGGGQLDDLEAARRYFDEDDALSCEEGQGETGSHADGAEAPELVPWETCDIM